LQCMSPLLALNGQITAPSFVAYWTNNGQRSVLTLDGYAANDPTATLALHCGNGFDVVFSPYQSTR
jgi:hypothetical protein